ncbi:MAG: hypothetical protein CMD81_01530 [Gammaproteobacteria bacterium]|nr:hypothetical protein [Gammaproteobacteria bacterium]HBF06612.1 hypothetical protein [Gammaproteobacteria bacterium]|tara:strand:- start:485 stop:847 length:363 start_codon:yes stop_codon:yes gene_type:complete
MDINGVGQDPFAVVDDLGIAEGEAGNKGVVTPEEALTVSRDEFVTGMEELGMSESDAEKMWDILSDGEPELTKEDFDLKEFADVEEVAGANQALMQQFISLMMSQVTKTDAGDLSRMVRR